MISIKRHNIKDLCDLHFQSIKEYIENRAKKLTIINQWISDAVGTTYNLEKLITASPTELAEIKIKWVQNGKLHKDDFEIFVTYYNYLNVLKDSDKKYTLPNGDKYSASYLAEKLNVTTCFYCNEHYIYHLNSNGKRIYDFDHFYNKNHYPLFALSFYNLIPTCKPCNTLKKDEDKDFANPYNKDIDFIKEMKFNASPNSADFLTNKNSIDLTITTNNSGIENNFIDMQIRERYEKHKDIAWDIYRKNHIYNQSYFKELTKNFDIFHGNRDNVMELLLGTSLINQDFEKRPFSRLIYDIANNLGMK